MPQTNAFFTIFSCLFLCCMKSVLKMYSLNGYIIFAAVVVASAIRSNHKKAIIYGTYSFLVQTPFHRPLEYHKYVVESLENLIFLI